MQHNGSDKPEANGVGVLRASVCCFSASDNSGHAGLQADLRTLSDLGVHGASVVTALTAQNSKQLYAVIPTAIEQLRLQWQTLADDLEPSVCKLGLIGSVGQMDEILAIMQAEQASQSPRFWLVDPVLQSSTGYNFHAQSMVASYQCLLPYVGLITPNIPEAEILLGITIASHDDVVAAAKALYALGAGAVLIKGGHSEHSVRCEDYFYSGTHQCWVSSARQAVTHQRGTGCVLASAIAAFIAHGKALHDAVVLAAAYVQQGLRLGYQIGRANGPIGNGGWPQQLADYPVVTIDADYLPPEPFIAEQALGLYPVIDSLAWLDRLILLGVSTIQLRVKNLKGEALREMVAEAIAMANKAQVRLYINDHWQLALELSAYGVHLGQEDINNADIDALRAAGIRLGISTHSEYEWVRAHSVRPSYIALGAVFATQTKLAQVIGLANLQRWVPLLQAHYAVTAIGGIHRERLDAVLATGVKSVAVVTAITQAEDYRKTTTEWLTRLGGRCLEAANA